MEETPSGLKVPKLTKREWRDWAKDAILFVGAVAAVFSWLSSRADNFVQSAAYQRDKTEKAERDEQIKERIKALETRTGTIETATSETKTDVKVMRVEQAASQKTLERIETILDERHRR
jgi:septal ring factor EnvC (AmiA/AmiB activator)